jgi:GntR family transcriptional regulator, rspAB operon transcriptional repressor
MVQTTEQGSGSPQTVNYPVDPGEAIAPQIYRHLRQAIVTMELMPGQALSEKDIAARFGVSRQPVREAFIKLREARLVRILPQRGTFVVRISISDVANARFVREAVEIAVVRTACAIAQPDALDRLSALIDVQAEAAGRGDQRTFLVNDEAFHRSLAESVDCSTAWPILEDVKIQMDRVRYLSLPEATPLDLLVVQHRAILDGIRARNVAAATEAMQRHLREILIALPRLAAGHPDLFEDLRMPAHVMPLPGGLPG